MSSNSHPLLTGAFRIPFHRLEAKHVEPGIRQALAEAQAEVDALCADDTAPTWDNTIGRLDRAGETLSDRIAPATHLMSVCETPELRESYNAVLPDMTAFWSGLPLNDALWQRLKAFAASDEAIDLTGIRLRHFDKILKEFERAGADLPERAKGRLQALRVELARLQQKFSENVLDATAAFELIISDEARLAGVPEAALERARTKAEEGGHGGWLITLDYPSVEPILKYCQDRELRREVLVAYATRCRAGKFDNRPLLAQILRSRDELAEILGYGSFPDYTLDDRMARTGARAIEFEADLVERTHPYWERDVAEVREHAVGLGIDDLQPWDTAYVMEHLRKTRYDIDDEVLRPYFPLEQVLDGMFEIVRRTFGFRIAQRDIVEVWHEDVRFYEIFDERDELVGAFYTDWFPRKDKRGDGGSSRSTRQPSPAPGSRRGTPRGSSCPCRRAPGPGGG